ncbi:MAG: antitoxin [Candidatus Brocadiales bacterium]|nr:antitoxin [Candidatus Brocadiales bacterium]
MKNLKLNKEEKEILESYERGELKPVKNSIKEAQKHKEYARNTLRKDKRVNIRISAKDLEDIQSIALEEAIPYQTLMASVLHKFASGRLVTKKNV